MNKLATSIEQSRKLVALGIDLQTADMYYLPQVMNEGETLWPIDEGYDLDDADQPAWSLSALLNVAMTLIGRQDLELRCNWNGKTWFAIEMAEQSAGCYDAENPIDAVFDLVVEHLKD